MLKISVDYYYKSAVYIAFIGKPLMIESLNCTIEYVFSLFSVLD